ncbi:hypothetical protein BDF14DRAFT_1882471 [Spinellus fusiger]|nr:hypothetical protein BDF14DRAFT_1882471 [Spinellus fusiger]
MRTFSLISTLLISAIAVTSGMQIKCNKNNLAWVWNCKSILDNWQLHDNTLYDPRYYKCEWSGMTTRLEIACKLLVVDSCTLVVTYGIGTHANDVGYTGAQMKEFVQQSLNQCSKDNLLNAAIRGGSRLSQGGLCLTHNAAASSCG